MRELIIYPTKDSIICNKEEIDTNEKLIVSNNSDEESSTLLYFDLPNSRALRKVIKIELNIYLVQNDMLDSCKKIDIAIYNENNDVSDDEVNCDLDSQDSLNIISYEIKNQVEEYIKIDVTELYRLNSGKSKFVLEIKANSESQNELVFYSKKSQQLKYYPYIKMVFESDKKKLAIKEDLDEKMIYKYYCKANGFYINKDYEKAMEYYVKLLKVFNRDLALSETLLYRSCICYIELEKFLHAYKLLNEALKIFPESADLYYVKALLNYTQCEHLKAKYLFEKYLYLKEKSNSDLEEIEDNKYMAHYYLGEIHFDTECYEEAFEEYIKCIVANSRFERPYNRIVTIAKIKEKDIGYIMKVFMKYKINKSKTQALYDLVDILIEHEEYLDANAILSHINDKDERAEYQYGLMFMQLKKYKDALKVFNHISEKYESEELNFNIVLCNLYLGRINEAKKLLYQISFGYTSKALVYRLLIYTVFDINTKIANKIVLELERNYNEYEKDIYDLIRRVLVTAEDEVFESALVLVDYLEGEDVHLKLGKLFFDNGFYLIALSEFVKSIKEYSHIDKEGLYQMKKCLLYLERMH